MYTYSYDTLTLTKVKVIYRTLRYFVNYKLLGCIKRPNKVKRLEILAP